MKVNRELLPLATFEHVQAANWLNGQPTIDKYDICEKIDPVRVYIFDIAKQKHLILTAEFILDVNRRLVSNLNGCLSANFKDPDEWQIFIDGLQEASDPEPIGVRDCGAWIISQLLWNHLTTLRLLTAYLIVDGLAIQQGTPRLNLGQSGLGRFIDDLSSSGPPIYDAENMRSQLHNYNSSHLD
jgi:hypothetical protein